MTDLQQRLTAVRSELPEGIQLVAVSKYHPATMIAEAYEVGQRIFAESHVQELEEKHTQLPKDIEWHFIGHLQTNKVRYMAPYVSLIHAVDSQRLLTEINKQAAKCHRVIPCLLQIHVAQEETKFGFTFDECRALLEEGTWRQLTHVQIAGLMCMASNTDDEAQIREEFHRVHTFFDQVRQTYFADIPAFKECSMGMSDDYPIAVSEGSTLVRVGSKIFGHRVYS